MSPAELLDQSPTLGPPSIGETDLPSRFASDREAFRPSDVKMSPSEPVFWEAKC